MSGAPLASAVPATEQEGVPLKKPSAAGLAIVVAMLAVPQATAAQASLTVDPVEPCYRELSRVRLPATGFTPNAPVVFTRDGSQIGEPVVADSGGALVALLRLPELVSRQRRLTYVATDSTNPSLSAQVSMLVTATAVRLQPEDGAAHRLLKIDARGFFGGATLYAHVVRAGPRPGRARNMRIGRVKGSCKTVHARKRLFARGTPPGKYRVQFDTFRRYKAKRSIETDFIVTVFRAAGTARASALNPAS